MRLLKTHQKSILLSYYLVILFIILIFSHFCFNRFMFFSFAQEATSTASTVEIATSTPLVVTSTAETTISTPPIATSTLEEIPNSTPINATSTLQDLAPTLENTTSGLPSSEAVANIGMAPVEAEEAEAEEEEIAIPSAPEPPALQSPPLKERKFNKQLQINENPQHFCTAKNFKIDVSNNDRTIIELEFNGRRNDTENLEIGSLPLGIDITFLNNSDYEWRPQKSDNRAVLQITNQPGSQKGNFNIPIIYQSGNSTTVCQVNVINF